MTKITRPNGRFLTSLYHREDTFSYLPQEKIGRTRQMNFTLTFRFLPVENTLH